MKAEYQQPALRGFRSCQQSDSPREFIFHPSPFLLHRSAFPLASRAGLVYIEATGSTAGLGWSAAIFPLSHIHVQATERTSGQLQPGG